MKLQSAVKSILALILIVVVVVLAASLKAPTAHRVVAVAADGTTVTVGKVPADQGEVPKVLTAGADEAPQVKTLKPGDFVSYQTKDDKSNGLKWIDLVKASDNQRVRALAASTVAVFLVAWLLVAWAGERLSALVIGVDNRYSNSKVQMTLWFFVVIVGYVALMVVRFNISGGQLLTGPGVPNNLLLLSGLSALTFAGAQAVTNGKIDSEAERIASSAPANAPVTQEQAHQQASDKLKPPAKTARLFHDLLTDNSDKVDFGDFQSIFITIIAIISYLLQLSSYLGSTAALRGNVLPDVDSTIVALFGVGQGAYLAKKAVG